MSNYNNNFNFLNLVGEVLAVLREVDSSQFGDPQFVRATRSLLKKLIKTKYDTSNIPILSSISLAEKFLLVRLLRETKEAAEELDELICEASFEAAFNFQISKELWMGFSKQKVSFEYIFSDLQKHSSILERV